MENENKLHFYGIYSKDAFECAVLDGLVSPSANHENFPFHLEDVEDLPLEEVMGGCFPPIDGLYARTYSLTFNR